MNELLLLDVFANLQTNEEIIFRKSNDPQYDYEIVFRAQIYTHNYQVLKMLTRQEVKNYKTKEDYNTLLSFLRKKAYL